MSDHPAWLRAWLAFDGLIVVVFGLFCILAPHMLFGSGGYRTGFRLIVGLLGALMIAVGTETVRATVRSVTPAVQSILRVLLISITLAPPVMTYNMSA